MSHNKKASNCFFGMLVFFLYLHLGPGPIGPFPDAIECPGKALI